jgi:flagellar basal-body rod protein FlgF
MDRLLYVAMTGAKQLMQAQTLVAHNLANVSTTGFRADLARFEAAPVEGPGYPSRINTVASGLDSVACCSRRRAQPTSRSTVWVGCRADEGRHRGLHPRRLVHVNALGLLETERGELVLGDNFL